MMAMMFWRTVSRVKMLGSCDKYPMPRRARLYMGIFVTSTPSKNTLPPSGVIMPMVMRNDVVLPAPLRPSRPTISP